MDNCASLKELCYKRFYNGHFADAVKVTYTELEVKVKKIYKKSKNEHYEGSASALMTTVFTVKNPIVEIADITDPIGKDIQQGYMRIYEGVMLGIRNPKAHENSNISKEDAFRKLIVASCYSIK